MTSSHRGDERCETLEKNEREKVKQSRRCLLRNPFWQFAVGCLNFSILCSFPEGTNELNGTETWASEGKESEESGLDIEVLSPREA